MSVSAHPDSPIDTFFSRKSPQKMHSSAQESQQSASWNFAESLLLRDTQADTLAILDTCFASNVNKGGVYSGRAYQLLAASGPDRMTAAPGPKSFTTAMIQVLNEWLEEDLRPRMTLWKLSARINDKFYRRQNPCFVQDRFKNHDRYIYLAPLRKHRGAREKKDKELKDKTGASDLTLRFGLGIKTLTKDHIEKLTKELPRACETADVELQRIDWVTFERRPVSLKNTVNAFSYAQHWLRETRRRKKKNDSPQGQPELSTADNDRPRNSTQPNSTSISTSVVNMKSDNTELVSMRAENAVLGGSVLSSSKHPTTNHDERPGFIYTRQQGGTDVSVNVGNMAQLTWAIIGMGVLSCATTIICNWAAPGAGSGDGRSF